MGEGSFSNLANEKECLCTDLGVVEVYETERFMSAWQGLRGSGAAPDLLLFLAHPKTVSVGLRDRLACTPKDLLVSPKQLEEEGIALARSIRGGGITYHWPGQIICYPVLSLQPRERDVPEYMSKLEQVGIETLRCFGLEANRRRETAAHVGLWLDGKKIVSMGVRVSGWVTTFGFALNLQGDHGPSCYVRPCGLDGVKLTTLEEALGDAPPRPWVIEALTASFVRVFGRNVKRIQADCVKGICSPTEPIHDTVTGSG
ncbi:MAG: lipoyl(octanoyl) transferase LipB [Desulfomonilaceae bacterium]